MTSNSMTFSREAAVALFDGPQSLGCRLFGEAKRLATADASSTVTLRHVEQAWLNVLQAEFNAQSQRGEFSRGTHSEAA